MGWVFISVVKDERPWGISFIEWRKLQEEPTPVNQSTASDSEASPVEQSTPSDSEGRSESDTDLPASV